MKSELTKDRTNVTEGYENFAQTNEILRASRITSE